ncbi:hypothetical protein [Companilactobacillus keshanensis]|uniref:DUF3221 domain-containing protein n=1 Tax=Companilactobacillus keshanensis TaxID=2486003 RepID=A0ABW4BYR5_9LACO|nr:hypothetical protein [Companilactobacillus keshanensis]
MFKRVVLGISLITLISGGSIISMKYNTTDAVNFNRVVKRKDYNYVSFQNLYENPQLYTGTKVYQYGTVEKVVFNSNSSYMLVVLNGKDQSNIIKLNFDYSKTDNANRFSVGTEVRFYGKVSKPEQYETGRGRETSRPVIEAAYVDLKK